MSGPSLRRARNEDAFALAAIFRSALEPGDSYVFDAARSDAELAGYWIDCEGEAWVADDAGVVLGVYRVVPNQPDRGSHVANASFVVAPAAQGRGIGRLLGEHALQRARALGYRAMQFNFVVADNAAAVALWTRLGFRVLATLPGAFRHARLGHVDALVMFREL